MSSKDLAGKHALVTGGSRGIGFAVAQRLLGMGASVTLMGRSIASLEQAAAALEGSGKVAIVSGDISQQADVRRAFGQATDRFGPVDILVNNAGQAVSERFDRLDEAAWQQMIAVNLTGTFHCMQAALADMLERIDAWERSGRTPASPTRSADSTPDPGDKPSSAPRASGSGLLEYVTSHPATRERLEYLRSFK